ncbi:MAG TPA: N-acetyltransferase [Longimicrobiales bacterium]|nr:N-acetyltransferase [Longimicrobiales bacterium]
MSPLAIRSETVVRPLEKGDRDAVARLVQTVALFSATEKDVAMEVVDSYLENPGKDYFALGAFTQRNGLLGYACYGPTPCTSGTWDLYWIAVSGETRGRGIGTALTEEIERRLVQQRARLVLIETSSRADYEPTRGFYERRGYEEVARVPDFYAVGDDRVIYARTFDSV